MKKISALIFVFLFIPLVCFAQEPKTQPASKESLPLINRNIGKWGKAVSGLRCKIETGKTVYGFADNMVITLTWQNVSDTELVIYYSDDDIVYRLLSVRREDYSVPLGRLIMIKNSPKHQLRLEPSDSYSLSLNAKLITEYLKEPWLKAHQEKAGNIILRFDGKLLGEFPILLDKPGNYYLSFNYFLPADSFLAKKEPNMWTGEISSEEIMIKVVDGK